MTTLTPSAAKQAVFEAIARSVRISKLDLHRSFSLTGSSMARILDELIAHELIRENGYGPSTGGRRPILYELNPTYGYLLGLEVSRTYSAIGLFDMALNPLASFKWNMDEDMDPRSLIIAVKRWIGRTLSRLDIPREKLIGLGIGSVGPLDRESGMLLNTNHFHAKGWKNIPFRSMMEDALGIKVVLESGASAALIGEHWSLKEELLDHMLYVHVGAGIRSAMMSDGRIVRGAADMEESIGGMIIQSSAPAPDSTGNYGVLKDFVTLNALEKGIQRLGKEIRSTRIAKGPEPAHVDFPALLQALQNNDPDIRKLFLQSANYLGIGLANIINMVHPEKVILGGPLVHSDSQYYETAIATASSNIYSDAGYRPRFSQGKLKEQAVAAGAAVIMLKKLGL
ncbi:ROK family protein [Paenibacillus sp. CAU 1782]